MPKAGATRTNPSSPKKITAHLLVNGCYQADELAFDDVRFEMLFKLLSRCFDEELAASESIADAMSRATGLPPYVYNANNAVRVGGSSYVWARNLLANRLFRSPVVYVEPYVMNNQAVIDRIHLGDYEGEREIGGGMRKSIFREYADAVAEGWLLFTGASAASSARSRRIAPGTREDFYSGTIRPDDGTDAA